MTSVSPSTVSTMLLVVILSISVTTITATSLPLSQSEIDSLLAAQNSARASVQPPAAYMSTLVWNSQLQSIAQNWADECISSNGEILDHNPNRSANYSTYVGENIFASTANITNMSQPVIAWDNEKIWYNLETNTCQSGEVCGHYTQLVWANTTSVGCGRSYCPNITFSYSIVCDYAPGGNYIGERPYVAAPLTSQSPKASHSTEASHSIEVSHIHISEASKVPSREASVAHSVSLASSNILSLEILGLLMLIFSLL
jgi:uncharacterized protein YkwD